MTELVTREDFVREAQRMRAEGMLVREIAEHFGVSRSAVKAWINDPDLSKHRARRERYRGTCERCGAKTDGSNGPGKAPRFCIDCSPAHQRKNEHGTASMYSNHGCRCEECKARNTELHNRWKEKVKGKPPKHGTANGYKNYGCRCDACTRAHVDSEWQHPEYQQRWRAKVKGTEPPQHGTSTAYNNYACRCEQCRAWCRNEGRRCRDRNVAAGLRADGKPRKRAAA